MTNLRQKMVTPVTEPVVLLSRVLRAYQRWLFTGITAQILMSPSAVRGQLHTRPT